MGADSKLKRYKVIKEYEHFYLTRNEKDWKECFDKIFYKPDEDGCITIKIKEFEARELLPQEKINKNWNRKFNFSNKKEV